MASAPLGSWGWAIAATSYRAYDIKGLGEGGRGLMGQAGGRSPPTTDMEQPGFH